MSSLTRTGTCLLALLLASCGHSGGNRADAGKPTSSSDAAITRDGARSGECDTHTDCVLVGKGCCGSCKADPNRVLAVPKSEEQATRQQQCSDGVACGPCAPMLYDPLEPLLRAACVDHRCAVVDLRKDESTACRDDQACELQGRGCCGGCGPDPRGYFALRSGTPDPFAARCDPTPPCVACTDDTQPEPYCAEDGHCAVRERPSVQGTPSVICFSPTQNLERAYESGAVGCDCFSLGAALCVPDKNGKQVALLCAEQGSWRAVEDGPCAR